ncbi:hypothetical protein FGO68_gene13016 [Halteria grandinella]|uniref:Uncharacterized protein n=1 Tax=Halteria grandinella TaxID=5974 RepID=A0A8J8NUV2_HALGN|nr:hypothetical protein FGO68_gene13016 [Halteria grandinella]
MGRFFFGNRSFLLTFLHPMLCDLIFIYAIDAYRILPLPLRRAYFKLKVPTYPFFLNLRVYSMLGVLPCTSSVQVVFNIYLLHLIHDFVCRQIIWWFYEFVRFWMCCRDVTPPLHGVIGLLIEAEGIGVGLYSRCKPWLIQYS